MNQEVQQVVEVVKEKERGPSGEVGVATPALTMRQLWHQAFFERIAGHGGVRQWQPRLGVEVLSLKRFARALLAKGDQVAGTWFDNKAGRHNQARSEANIKAAREAAFATKTERRKKSALNAAKKK